GSRVDVPTRAVAIVDVTGAGDIFAAAYLVHLRRSNDPFGAARFATCLATQSITRRGLESIPTPLEIEQCLAV
ncbi:MAG TPA: PfkB family carbohydrate kinase, partial [Anaerolineae bacterium]|nr:PfkB family carbohydrate kinase [Anaerolineae bacterium]